jgi:ligand-binding sensor domain-containing protein
MRSGSYSKTSEGVIWAGTTAGISRFLRASPPFTNYIQSRADNGLQDNVIRSVQTDRKGFLWVGTETALHRLDRKTGQISVYKHDPANPHSISNNKVAAIVEELSGKIWFGSYGGGLNLFDPATGRFRAYRGDWDKPGALSSDQVSCLLLDREETLWVGTLGAGLNRFDRGTETFRSYRDSPHDPHSLSNNHVTTLLEDHFGSLWVGTNRGLDRLDSSTQRFVHYAFDSSPGLGRSLGHIVSSQGPPRRTLGQHPRWIVPPRPRPAPSRSSLLDGLPDNWIASILEDTSGDLACDDEWSFPLRQRSGSSVL